MFRTVQIIFGVIGLLAVFAGDRFSMPVLLYGGIVCFGFMAMAIGWEAIITQCMVTGSRRRGSRQTYSGLPATLQGIQFNLIGIFLIVISAMTYLNYQSAGREIFLQFVRRPGIPLLFFGMIMLMQAVITLTGSHELRQGPRWLVIMNLLISRLLPGGILVVLGLGALWLGVFEIIAPVTFDERGGGFLEVLYGLR
jgi:hypothetical protein